MSVGPFAAGGKARRANGVFLAVVLAAALGLILWQRAVRTDGAALVAVLRYGEPEQTLVMPLDEPAVYDVDTGLYTVHIRVQDGTAAFVQSPCPDHTCEGFGALKDEGAWAACLPAKAILTIEKEPA